MSYRDNCSNDEADAFDKAAERLHGDERYIAQLYKTINKLREENEELKKENKNLRKLWETRYGKQWI